MNTHSREFVMVERQAVRERAERTIEALIAMLDELDGDPDLEPSISNHPYINADRSLVDIEGDEVELFEGYFEDDEDDEPREDDGDAEEDCRSWPLDDYPLDQTPAFIGGLRP